MVYVFAGHDVWDGDRYKRGIIKVIEFVVTVTSVKTRGCVRIRIRELDSSWMMVVEGSECGQGWLMWCKVDDVEDVRKEVEDGENEGA